MKLIFAALMAATAALASAAPRDSGFDAGARLFSAERYREAEPLLATAAGRGDARAQALIGRIYDEGLGVRRDAREAAKWFAQAAAQGHRAAQFALGGLYENGDGVTRDERKGSELFERSARQGFSPAQFAIGINYEVGRGVARNRQTALQWLNQAAKSGDDDARVVGYWLKQPGTPTFQSERQLTAWVASKMPRPSGGLGGLGSAPGGRSIQDRQYERHRCQSVGNVNDRQACMNGAG